MAIITTLNVISKRVLYAIIFILIYVHDTQIFLFNISLYTLCIIF